MNPMQDVLQQAIVFVILALLLFNAVAFCWDKATDARALETCHSQGYNTVFSKDIGFAGNDSVKCMNTTTLRVR